MSSWIETESGIILPPIMMGSGQYTISTLVDGGRNTNGKFVGSIVGEDKLSIDLEFINLLPEEFKRFLLLFDNQRGGSFVNKFKVFDPRLDDWTVKEMYVSDRSGRPLKVDKNTFKPVKWGDVKAKLVEV